MSGFCVDWKLDILRGIHNLYMNKIKTSPKDFFLHLLSSITLYMAAIAFLTVVFQYINHFFPDTLNDYAYRDFSNSPMRFGISMLVVVFPVYLWSVMHLDKVYSKHPEKKDLRIRKWLTYFTVFIAAFIIIGDLISLINNFLSGELTTRFVLKVLAVLIVALVIFSYYIMDVKDKMISKYKKIYAWSTIVFSLGFVIAAFFVVGSPQDQRDERLDQDRIQDLSSIENTVQWYYVEENVLPETLGDLEGRTKNPYIPVDPDTEEPYEYTVTGEMTYQLCAVFATDNIDSEDYVRPVINNKYGVMNLWLHEAGRHCFDIEVYQQDVESVPNSPLYY